MRIGLEERMDNIADSLTNWALERSPKKTDGTSWVSEVYVQVHWPWMALPAAINVLSIIFLISTALITRSRDHRLWKTSTLSILYHGLDESLLRHKEVYSTLSMMETTAGSTNIGFQFSRVKSRVLLQE